MPHIRNQIAGKAVASGGYGCVFLPPIKSDAHQATIDGQPYVTKLMTKKHAAAEMAEIDEFLPTIKTIKNYRKHFIMEGVFVADSFGPLTTKDKVGFERKCRNIKGITIDNINSKLSTVSALYIPYGGISIQQIVSRLGREHATSHHEFGLIVSGLIKTFTSAIIPMNKKGIIHSDIKGANLLVDEEFYNSPSKTPDIKLIDWGLASKILKGAAIDVHMPLQYNAPFSIILLDMNVAQLIDEWSTTRIINNELNMVDCKSIAVKLIYMNQQDGVGHSDYILTIFNRLVVSPWSVKFAPAKGSMFELDADNIDKGILKFSYIVDYIADILNNFVVVKKTATGNIYFFDTKGYFYNVYRYNCDVWGFLSIFVDYVIDMGSKREYLNSKIAQKITSILFKYCYSTKYASIKIPVKELIKDLNELVDISVSGKSDYQPSLPSTRGRWSIGYSINKKTRKRHRK